MGHATTMVVALLGIGGCPPGSEATAPDGPAPTDAPAAQPEPEAAPAAAEPETHAEAPPSEPSRPALPPEVAALPFSDLLRLPQTFVYDVDGSEIACRFEDAGIEGSDVDFRVRCDPHERQCEVPDIRVAPDYWKSGGCYVVRPRGLYYFADCPAALPAKGGVRMLSPKMLETAAHAKEDDVVQRSVQNIVIGGRTFEQACFRQEDHAMHAAYASWGCMAPTLGYVSAGGSVVRTDPGTGRQHTECTDNSTLLRVE